MKQRGVFLIGLILMSIYYFLFPRGTGEELVLMPTSFISLSSYEIPSAPASGGLISVRSGDTAAYFTDNFDLSARYGSPYMAVNDQWLVVPGREGLDLIEPDGRLRARLSGDAVPVESGGALFLYHPDIGRLRRIDPSNGAQMWSRDFLAAPTVLHSSAGRTLVGLLDGRALVLDEAGDVILRYRPGGSRLEAVYGGALNSDGTGLALVAGLDPQRFILLEERKNGFRPVTHHDTDSDFRRFVPVGFTGNDSRVLYEGQDSVMVVDTSDYSVSGLALDGRPLDWADDPESGSLALLGGTGPAVNLRVLSLRDLTFFESALPAGTTGLKMDDKHLMFVGEEYFAVLGMEVH